MPILDNEQDDILPIRGGIAFRSQLEPEVPKTVDPTSVDQTPVGTPRPRYIVNPRTGSATVPKEHVENPTLIEDAFRYGDNIVGSAYTRFENRYQGSRADTKFNPHTKDNIAGYEEHAADGAFDWVKNEEQNEWQKRQIDQEREAKKRLDEAGWWGVGARVASGVLDLPTLLSFGTLGAMRGGVGLVRGAATIGGVAAAETAATEAVLQGLQYERTFEESAFAVGGALVVGSVLGGVAGRIGAKEVARIEEKVATDMQAMAEGKGLDSIGAMRATTNLDAIPAEATVLADRGMVGVVSPDALSGVQLRMLKSDIPEERELSLRFFERAQRVVGDSDGTLPQIRSIEADISLIEGKRAEAARAFQEMTREMRVKIRNGYTMNPDEFAELQLFAKRAGVKIDSLDDLADADILDALANFAARVGDESPIPAVTKYVKKTRELMNEIGKRALDSEMIDTMSPLGSKSYSPRVFDRPLIAQNSEQFKDAIRPYLISRERAEGYVKGKDLSDPTYKNIYEQTVKYDTDALVEEVYEKLMGEARGSIDVALNMVKTGKQGSAMARSLAIPDEVLVPFMNKKHSAIIDDYLNSMGRQVSVYERFGTLDFDKIWEPVKEGYIKKAEAVGKNTPEGKKIMKNLAKRTKEVREAYSAQLGRYEGGNYPELTKMSQRARMLSYLSLMGGIVTSSLADMAKPMIAHGILKPTKMMLKMVDPDIRKMTKADAEYAGVATDMALNQSRLMLQSEMEPEALGKVDQVLQRLVSGFSKWSGANAINAWSRIWMYGTTADDLLGTLSKKSFAELGADLQTKLRSYGIDEAGADAIAKQFKKYGEVKKGYHIPNVNDWDDYAAKYAYETYVTRRVNMGMTTIGSGTMPTFYLGTQHPFNKVVHQFTSFAYGMQQQLIVRGLQDRDANFIVGMLIATGLGALTTKLKAAAGGREQPEGYKLVLESMDRGGVLGWLMMFPTFLDKAQAMWTQERILGDSRYSYGTDAITNIGPAVSQTANVVRGAVGIGAGALTEAGVLDEDGESGTEMMMDGAKKMAQAAPGRNMWDIKWYQLGLEALEGTNKLLERMNESMEDFFTVTGDE